MQGVRGAIVWKNVHFSYSADREVLKGISFQIKDKWCALQVVQEKEKVPLPVTVWSVSQRAVPISFLEKTWSNGRCGNGETAFPWYPQNVFLFTEECCRECGVRKGRSCERRN